MQRRGHVTASSFGEIVKRRLEYAPLVIRLLYSKAHTTKAMRYGHDNEPKARDLYLKYLRKYHHNDATVQKTGFHIDFQVFTSWSRGDFRHFSTLQFSLSFHWNVVFVPSNSFCL